MENTSHKLDALNKGSEHRTSVQIRLSVGGMQWHRDFIAYGVIYLISVLLEYHCVCTVLCTFNQITAARRCVTLLTQLYRNH